MSQEKPEMSRRAALGGITLSAAGVSAAETRADSHNRKAFVLVHGTWHGGWEWRDVRRILCAQS